MDTEALAEGSLRSYLRILTNRKWSVAIVMVITLAATFVYTHRQATIYQASAGLLLAPTPAQQFIQGASITYSIVSVPDQIQVLEGNGVASEVAKTLGSAPGISGSQVGQTDEMLVTAEASNRTMAAKIANAYTQAYLTYLRESTVDSLNKANAILEKELGTIQSKLTSLQSQLNTAQQKGETSQQDSLNAQISSLQSQQSVINQEVTTIAQAVQFSSSGAQVVQTATPPSSPIQPDLKKNLLFGFVAGLVLGIGFVVAREYFDDTIRSEEELHLALARSEKTSKVLLLGAIPFGEEILPGMPATSSKGVVAVSDPTSPQSEAYRELRTSLQFLQVREPIEVVLVTSPSGGEGKSTTLANLAVMLAKTGKSVVVASCDLRRPRLHEYFGVGNQVGFTSVILGDRSLSDAIQPVPDVDGLAVLSAGPLPPNPAELLASPGAEEIVMHLKSRFDVVLIDSPPVLRVTDAAVISTLADTTLLIVRAGLTTRRDMAKSLDTFDRIGSPVAGVVVNALPTELTYKDRYYYSPLESTDYSLDRTDGPNGNGNGNGKGRHKVPAHVQALSEAEVLRGELGDDPPAARSGTGRLTFADDDPGTAPRPRPSAGAPARPLPPHRGRVATWLLGPPKRRPSNQPPTKRQPGRDQPLP